MAGAPPALAPALFRVAGRGRPQPRLPSAPLFEECLPTLCPLLKAQSAEGEGEDGEERGGAGGIVVKRIIKIDKYNRLKRKLYE